MGYINFVRNQTNAANNIIIPVDGIINITSTGATDLVIQYNWGHGPDASPAELLTMTMQVGATGSATLTRINIVQKVIDTIAKAGLSGPTPTVPDMEVQTAAWTSAAIETTP